MSDKLILEEIATGYAGLTVTSGGHLLEGCVITLYRQGHNSGSMLNVKGFRTKEFELKWDLVITDQLDRTWKDQIYATEQAAVCIAILTALKFTGFEIIERSVRKTGCDYWIGTTDGILFEKKARLEVSGIFNGDNNDVEGRFKQKCKQTEQSDSIDLPAYISISEFSSPLSKFDKKP